MKECTIVKRVDTIFGEKWRDETTVIKEKTSKNS